MIDGILNNNHALDKCDSYVQMQLNDVLLYTDEHFLAVKDVLYKNEGLTHIVTVVRIDSINIDKDKFIKVKKIPNTDTETVILDNYVFATIVDKIDTDLDGYDLKTCKIFTNIHNFLSQCLKLH